MRKKTGIKLTALLLALLLTALLLPEAGFVPASATSAEEDMENTQEEIDSLQGELEDIRAQQASVQSQLDAVRNDLSKAREALDLVQTQVNLTESQINATQELIDAIETKITQKDTAILNLQNQIVITQQDVDRSARQLKLYDGQIALKEADVIELEQEEEVQKQVYYANIRWIEELGPTSYLNILFKVSTFEELLDQASVITEMMSYQDEVIDHLQETQASLKEARDILQVERDNQAEVKAQQEQLEADLVQQKAQLEKEMEELETESANLTNTKTALVSQKNQLEIDRRDAQAILNKIAASESEYAQMAAQLAAAEDETAKALKAAETRYSQQLAALQNEGAWYWPVPGYTNLSSLFGNRSDPITGNPDHHTGTDIPVPDGTQVRSAQGGVVVYVSQNDYTTYGWYVMVGHGNGYVTLYAHLNSQAVVKEGQVVSKGQLLGYSGSSGRTTGPHLHFELRIDGVRADVLTLYDGYTFTSPNGGTIMGG